MKTINKIWGREEWLVNNELYCAKYLYINSGFKTSIHFHKEKDETFIVISGFLDLLVGFQNIYLTQGGDTCRIKPRQFHQLRNNTVSELKVLEVSTPHKDSDCYRIKKGGEVK